MKAAMSLRSATRQPKQCRHASIRTRIERATSKESTTEARLGPESIREETLSVAYQGVPGAYSQEAATTAYPGCNAVACDNFESAFQMVQSWTADRAVLPIENSLGGSIHANFDLLLKYRLHIVGEVYLPINHCLMCLPEQDMKDVEKVLSHPQALAQCEGYLQKLGVVKEEFIDTAGAAKNIKENMITGAAAIASACAAELYGMKVLETGIQDHKTNVTRFIALARDPLMQKSSVKKPYKTSICFSLNEAPGVLFKALSVFALRDIDLTKIESRPMRTNPVIESRSGRQFNFLFYVDFVGSLIEEPCQNALRHLQEISPYLRVLGSYPMDTSLNVNVWNEDTDPLNDLVR